MRAKIVLGVLSGAGLLAGWLVGSSMAERASADLTPEGGAATWLFSGDIGGDTASSLQRARAVRSGTFALSAEETVYFFTDRDQAGEPLLDDCTYEVTGSVLNTQWWSLTVYGEDYFFIPNDQNRSSFNSINMVYDDAAKTSWTVVLSPQFQEGNWLPTEGAGRPELLYRLYRPSDALRNVLPDVDLPTVRRVTCNDV